MSPRKRVRKNPPSGSQSSNLGSKDDVITHPANVTEAADSSNSAPQPPETQLPNQQETADDTNRMYDDVEEAFITVYPNGEMRREIPALSPCKPMPHITPNGTLIRHVDLSCSAVSQEVTVESSEAPCTPAKEAFSETVATENSSQKTGEDGAEVVLPNPNDPVINVTSPEKGTPTSIRSEIIYSSLPPHLNVDHINRLTSSALNGENMEILRTTNGKLRIRTLFGLMDDSSAISHYNPSRGQECVVCQRTISPGEMYLNFPIDLDKRRLWGALLGFKYNDMLRVRVAKQVTTGVLCTDHFSEECFRLFNFNKAAIEAFGVPKGESPIKPMFRSRPWNCTICSFTSFSVADTHEHIVTEHRTSSVFFDNPEGVSCPFCRKCTYGYKTLSGFKRHMRAPPIEHGHLKKIWETAREMCRSACLEPLFDWASWTERNVFFAYHGFEPPQQRTPMKRRVPENAEKRRDPPSAPSQAARRTITFAEDMGEGEERSQKTPEEKERRDTTQTENSEAGPATAREEKEPEPQTSAEPQGSKTSLGANDKRTITIVRAVAKSAAQEAKREARNLAPETRRVVPEARNVSAQSCSTDAKRETEQPKTKVQVEKYNVAEMQEALIDHEYISVNHEDDDDYPPMLAKIDTDRPMQPQPASSLSSASPSRHTFVYRRPPRPAGFDPLPYKLSSDHLRSEDSLLDDPILLRRPQPFVHSYQDLHDDILDQRISRRQLESTEARLRLFGDSAVVEVPAGYKTVLTKDGPRIVRNDSAHLMASRRHRKRFVGF